MSGLWRLVGEMQDLPDLRQRQRHVLRRLCDLCDSRAAMYYEVAGLCPADFATDVARVTTVGLNREQRLTMVRDVWPRANETLLKGLRDRLGHRPTSETVIAGGVESPTEELAARDGRAKLHAKAGIGPSICAVRHYGLSGSYGLLAVYRLQDAPPFEPAVEQLIERFWSGAGWLLTAALPGGDLQAPARGQRRAQPTPDLPPRLQEVFHRLLAGQSAAAIAAALNLSVHTVYEHMQRLYRRLGVQGRADLLLNYLDHGAPAGSDR